MKFKKIVSKSETPKKTGFIPTTLYTLEVIIETSKDQNMIQYLELDTLEEVEYNYEELLKFYTKQCNLKIVSIKLIKNKLLRTVFSIIEDAK